MSQARFERHEHPLLRRNYRVATTAIESFVDLVERCLRVLMPGALVYARPRMGKTHAVDYVCLHLARVRPEVLTIRMSCEHHRTDFEGSFFSSLLIAAGASGDVLKRSITVKRQELIRRLRERLAARKGHIVALFCDEAQRQSRNSYEWLRDVHDQLAYHGIRLITFLIGQPQLLAQKAGFQMSGDEQIVARFMIEQMLFHGIRDAGEAATCLAGYDKTRYPEGSGPTFTGFFLERSFAAGLRLEHSGADLWNAFVRAHAQAQLTGPPEIQMDYFTRAVESLLAQGNRFDDPALALHESYWTQAVEESGYVGAQRSVAPALG
jgi:AAA domain